MDSNDLDDGRHGRQKEPQEQPGHSNSSHANNHKKGTSPGPESGTAKGSGGHVNASRSAGQASPAQSQNTIGHYVLVKALGEGTFGKVKLGTHILTGEKVSHQPRGTCCDQKLPSLSRAIQFNVIQFQI